MSSWLGYCVYPTEDATLPEMVETLKETITEELVAVSRYESSDAVTPRVYPERGCLGRRCSTSSHCPREQFKELLLEWLTVVWHGTAVAFLIEMSDTTDKGTLSVYEPTKEGLTRTAQYEGHHQFVSASGSQCSSGSCRAGEFDSKLVSPNGTDITAAVAEEYGHRPTLF